MTESCSTCSDLRRANERLHESVRNAQAVIDGLNRELVKAQEDAYLVTEYNGRLIETMEGIAEKTGQGASEKLEAMLKSDAFMDGGQAIQCAACRSRTCIAKSEFPDGKRVWWCRAHAPLPEEQIPVDLVCSRCNTSGPTREGLAALGVPFAEGGLDPCAVCGRPTGGCCTVPKFVVPAGALSEALFTGKQAPGKFVVSQIGDPKSWPAEIPSERMVGAAPENAQILAEPDEPCPGCETLCPDCDVRRT